MKKAFNLFYTDLFLCPRLFWLLGGNVVLFILSFFYPWLSTLPFLMFFSIVLALVLDLFLLFQKRGKVLGRRVCPERLSNSDENEVRIELSNLYPFNVQIGIIDEVPEQFQKRNMWESTHLGTKKTKSIAYTLRPTKRGEYSFGSLRLYVKSTIGFVQRRFNYDMGKTVPVYPSFLYLRQYELMAISNRLSDYGIKKIRRLGHSMEFDQIKNYVKGDDYRTVNWKATARQGNLMVNSYIDEKAQHVYSIIDKSRAMRMPFYGLSLLDYAINASLALSRVVLKKEDKTGLITISERMGTLVAADNKTSQLQRIMNVLYKEKTRYLESNMELLYANIRRHIHQRSLLLFFTNFESMSALNRQLPYLKGMAKFHLLIVVFFENTELSNMSGKASHSLREAYHKTIAEKFIYEKKLISKELLRHGIQSILTPPEMLTINTINKYLELKAKQAI
ncbi:DUF58 domain-containing protein [Olivibacter sitiensis]|uniref:DUF58 domain-containing protein n=1 Tax=Olivibacter sitiensis TaxID=376470 RepID=UPI0004006333|nr:DUF58 domain-containing protein [Olivibacter sitiensis]